MRSDDEEAGSPPEVYVIRLTGALALRLTIYGTAMFYLASLLVWMSYPPAGAAHAALPASLFWLGLIAIAAAAGTIVLHEAIHGLCMWLFGARPRFGVGIIGYVVPYAYAVAPGAPFTLRQILIIGLAPFAVISPLAWLAMWLVPSLFAVASIVFITNVSGSIGDLWMAVRLWHFRGCRDLVTIDVRDRMSLHTADPRGRLIAARFDSNDPTWMARLVLRSVLAASAMLTLTAPLGLVLSMVTTGQITIGLAPFPLAVYDVVYGSGFDVEFDLRAMLAASVLLAAVSLPLRRRARPPRAGTANVPRPAFL